MLNNLNINILIIYSIPYFPYGKQSKQKKTRGAITAKCNYLL